MLERLRGPDRRSTAAHAADALPLLADAARRLEPFDPGLARDTHFEAVRAAIVAGRLGPGTLDAAAAARAAPRAGRAGPRRSTCSLDGLALRFTDGYAASAPALKRALAALREEGEGRALERPLAVARPARRAGPVRRRRAGTTSPTRGVQLARESGALAVLPVALHNLAHLRCLEGDLDGAGALLDEADAIAARRASSRCSTGGCRWPAYRGDEAEALGLFEATEPRATARGEGDRAHVLRARARRPVQRPRPLRGRAGARARSAVERDELRRRCGRCPSSWRRRRAAARPTWRAPRSSGWRSGRARRAPSWRSGIEARSRALVSDGDVADGLYREAIERLGRTRLGARARPCPPLYGEWLRRDRRRIDARDQLRVRAEHVHRDGRRGVRRARGPRAAGDRRDGAQAQRRDAGTSSPRRRRRSRSSPATACRTPRSAPSCSSARARSSTTCTRCSPSSGSPVAGTWAACFRASEQPGAPRDSPRGDTGASLMRRTPRSGDIPHSSSNRRRGQTWLPSGAES